MVVGIESVLLSNSYSQVICSSFSALSAKVDRYFSAQFCYLVTGLACFVNALKCYQFMNQPFSILEDELKLIYCEALLEELSKGALKLENHKRSLEECENLLFRTAVRLSVKERSKRDSVVLKLIAYYLKNERPEEVAPKLKRCLRFLLTKKALMQAVIEIRRECPAFDLKKPLSRLKQAYASNRSPRAPAELSMHVEQLAKGVEELKSPEFLEMAIDLCKERILFEQKMEQADLKRTAEQKIPIKEISASLLCSLHRIVRAARHLEKKDEAFEDKIIDLAEQWRGVLEKHLEEDAENACLLVDASLRLSALHFVLGKNESAMSILNGLSLVKGRITQQHLNALLMLAEAVREMSVENQALSFTENWLFSTCSDIQKIFAYPLDEERQEYLKTARVHKKLEKNGNGAKCKFRIEKEFCLNKFIKLTQCAIQKEGAQSLNIRDMWLEIAHVYREFNYGWGGDDWSVEKIVDHAKNAVSAVANQTTDRDPRGKQLRVHAWPILKFCLEEPSLVKETVDHAIDADYLSRWSDKKKPIPDKRDFALETLEFVEYLVEPEIDHVRSKAKDLTELLQHVEKHLLTPLSPDYVKTVERIANCYRKLGVGCSPEAWSFLWKHAESRAKQALCIAGIFSAAMAAMWFFSASATYIPAALSVAAFALPPFIPRS